MVYNSRIGKTQADDSIASQKMQSNNEDLESKLEEVQNTMQRLSQEQDYLAEGIQNEKLLKEIYADKINCIIEKCRSGIQFLYELTNVTTDILKIVHDTDKKLANLSNMLGDTSFSHHRRFTMCRKSVDIKCRNILEEIEELDHLLDIEKHLNTGLDNAHKSGMSSSSDDNIQSDIAKSYNEDIITQSTSVAQLYVTQRKRKISIPEIKNPPKKACTVTNSSRIRTRKQSKSKQLNNSSRSRILRSNRC